MNKYEQALNNVKQDTVDLEEAGGQSNVSVEDITIIEKAVSVWMRANGEESSYKNKEE